MPMLKVAMPASFMPWTKAWIEAAGHPVRKVSTPRAKSSWS